jgi:hypothetical protein
MSKGEPPMRRFVCLACLSLFVTALPLLAEGGGESATPASAGAAVEAAAAAEAAPSAVPGVVANSDIEELGNTVYSRAGDYNVTFPSKDWKKAEKPKHNSDIDYESRGAADTFVDHENQELTVTAYAKLVTEGLKKNMPGLVEKGTKELTIGGLKAVQSQFVAPTSDTKLEYLVTYFVTEKKTYSITSFSLESLYSENEKDFKAIADSFRIGKPAANSGVGGGFAVVEGGTVKSVPGKFQVKLPSGEWKLDGQPKAADDDIELKTSAGGGALLGWTAQDLKVTAFSTLALEHIKKNVKDGLKDLKSTETKIGGLAAVENVFNANVADTDFKYVVTCLSGNGKCYSVVCYCPAALYDSLSKDFTALAHSFSETK